MKNFIAGLLGVLIALPAWSADQLLDIPHPILDEYKPEVRAMLAGARGRFELMSLEATGPDLGLAYGRLGIHYYAHAEQDAARACFVNATALDPDNFRWPYYLAVHYAETGAFARAVRVFDRVLALQPGDVPTLTRLGLALLELDRVDEAETRLKAAIVSQPANAAAFAGLARVAERRDDWESAITHYQKALSLQPEASQLHYRLGQAHRRAGNIELAKTHLQQRGQRIASIDDPLLTFMDAHTRPAGYYAILGDKALGEGESARAATLYDVAYAIDPTQVGAIVGLARIAFLDGENVRAREWLDLAIGLDKDSWSALQLKGLVELQDGDASAAIANLEKSVMLQDFPQTRVFLANTLMATGRFAEAARHYDVAAKAANASTEVRYRAAMAHIAAGNCNAAEALLLSAYEDDPAMAKVVLALARIYSSCIDADDEKLQAAVRYAEVLYNGHPSLETSETLAMAMAATGRFDDAVDYQAQAIFEALKTGGLDHQPQLQQNMERYRNQQRAMLPWPSGHAVFSLQAERSAETSE